MKILVADDNANCRYLILDVLSPVASEIFSATNGGEAWNRLQARDAPHMAILSATLPELNGLEICHKIRHARVPHYTYVILVGSRRDKADMLNAFEAGVDDYVVRPLTPAEILARVRVGRRFLEKEDHLSMITQQWRTMIDHLPFGLACLGQEGEIRRVNKVFAEQLGIDPRSLIGKGLRPAILPRMEDHRLLLDHLHAVREFDRREMQMTNADGRPFQVLVWGRPIDRTGELAYQIITAIKQ